MRLLCINFCCFSLSPTPVCGQAWISSSVQFCDQWRCSKWNTKSCLGFLLCWFRNRFCCRTLLLECLRSAIAESHGFWLILQLYTFVLPFSPLPLWFASLSPVQHPFASFSPEGGFMIQGNLGYDSGLSPGEAHGQERGDPLVLCHHLPTKPWLPGPLPHLQRQTGDPAAGGRAGTRWGRGTRSSGMFLWAHGGLKLPATTEGFQGRWQWEGEECRVSELKWGAVHSVHLLPLTALQMSPLLRSLFTFLNFLLLKFCVTCGYKML